jgi:hypothetical protein
MRHTSQCCQRSNRQPDYPGAPTYKLELTVRTNGATSFSHTCHLRRVDRTLRFNSLFDAHKKYFWPHEGVDALNLPAGTDFASSFAVLEALQAELRAGLATNDNERVRTAARQLMIWGGVLPGNDEWLDNNHKDLCGIIGAACKAIAANETDALDGVSFTSGRSKVYALACDDFVIYDSRVAAALGRAVVLFCRQTGRQVLPSTLNLPWTPARTAGLLRNPSEGAYRFVRLRQAAPYPNYGASNLKASWLLSEVASRCKSGAFAGVDPAVRLRALESALFMIGYDLSEPAGDAGFADVAPGGQLVA